MYEEDDLLMISALQHYLFCKRQCALIHIEQQWEENRFTAEGRILHERVHTAGLESRGDLRLEYDLALRTLKLGLSGRADVVEFYRRDNGGWQPFPVEYMRGKPKKDNSDLVQLCAQAICLEEMLAVKIEKGALYYGIKKRRTEVEFDLKLRTTTEETAKLLHDLVSKGETPPPEYGAQCKSCSFLSLCLPTKIGKTGESVCNYFDSILDL